MAALDGFGAVVTGGGSGIGRATAHRLARDGARVAVFDISDDAAKKVAGEIDGAAWTVDVTDLDAVAAAVHEANTRVGPLRIVVNNAGIGGLSPLADWSPDEWDRIIRVSLYGTFHVLRAAAPLILANGGGACVNLASISGVRPAAGEAPYSAAKAGIAALTASAALEYAPTLRVNAVAPGAIRTALTTPLFEIAPDQQERWTHQTPLARIGEPEDIADVIAFLVSDDARFITGQTIVIDGGMTLHGAGVDGLLDRFFKPS